VLQFDDPLPLEPPPVPDYITHLWLAPDSSRRVLIWTQSDGWRNFFPYDRFRPATQTDDGDYRVAGTARTACLSTARTAGSRSVAVQQPVPQPGLFRGVCGRSPVFTKRFDLR
jgi:hypothetical protein